MGHARLWFVYLICSPLIFILHLFNLLSTVRGLSFQSIVSVLRYFSLLIIMSNKLLACKLFEAWFLTEPLTFLDLVRPEWNSNMHLLFCIHLLLSVYIYFHTLFVWNKIWSKWKNHPNSETDDISFIPYSTVAVIPVECYLLVSVTAVWQFHDSCCLECHIGGTVLTQYIVICCHYH